MNSIQFVFRLLLCLLGILLALPLLVLITMAFQLPITISGIGYLFGGLLLVSSLIVAPFASKLPSILVISGVVVILAIALARLILAQLSHTQNIKTITLPHEKSTRWISYWIDEQDSLIFGEALFHRIGGDSVKEHENITSALFSDYSKMRSDQRVVPSPFIDTYLNLQKPTHFDTEVIEPETNAVPKFAVVFLHGYMGNVTAQCWEIAQAIKVFGAVAICPSTDWTGAWWEPQGQAILQETFKYVRDSGIQKFYLGGFSNGGLSINRLTSQLKNENGLAGLIFIDGIQEGESIRDTGLPVLVIQGTQDERIPVEGVRQVVKAIGDSATYVELDADHFLIMKQPNQVQHAIMKWLEKLEPAL
jgi:pimeloyl-ACP methyl ester carboxylesterase